MSTGFFKNLPNIAYDFKSDGNFTLAKDLFSKVGVWKNLQEGVIGYNWYRIKDTDRPDTIATKLYGDATLYWLIFLVNEHMQDLNDWPKSGREFNRFIDRKYPGTCLIASSSTDIVSSTSKFQLGEKVSQSADTYGFVTHIDPTHNRITLNSVNGTFTTSGTATGSDSEKSFTISSVVTEKDTVNHYLDSDDIKTTVSTGNTPVSNIEHERNLNEDKFSIKYIQPEYRDKVVSEFRSLMRG